MLQDLRRLLGAYATRLQAFVAATPPGSLQVTGVLGLAALLFAYYHLRRPSAPPPSNRAARSAAGTAGPRLGSGGAAAAGSSLGAAAAAAKAGGSGRQQQELAATTPLGRAVRVKLSGVGKVTISSLGTLAEEGASTELQEGVSLQPSALAVLREVAACTDTYIITQVQDDIGQAVMLGALEAAGLLGRGPGQVRPHHVLFCSTLDGKVSLVRQLEPDLHIDNSAKTIADLQRFMPRLLHIASRSGSGSSGAAAAGQSRASNVFSSASLAAYFE